MISEFFFTLYSEGFPFELVARIWIIALVFLPFVASWHDGWSLEGWGTGFLVTLWAPVILLAVAPVVLGGIFWAVGL